ncbi:MAG: porin [Proteobacteria bacterium]|nr:porin [Pseudomonadota bacterium]
MKNFFYLVTLVLITAMGPTAYAAAPAPAPTWFDGVKFWGHVEAGITGNTDDPSNGLNFGHLFTDRANEPLMNQLLLTVERPIDTSSKTYDLGFRLQGMYGSDARYTHFLGELDDVTHDRHALDIVEANLQLHTPWLTPGGIDFKLGQYVTLEGAEVIDAAGNFFYSHSYIFNFGIPLKHTGLMTITHLSPMFDLYLGVDSGVNTSLGGEGDNNDDAAFHGGLGINGLLDGRLNILATTHIGAENPRNATGINVHALRYLNDITAIFKVNDKLTATTDLNYIKDDAFDVEAGGVAQYFTYAVNDWLSVGVRGEVYRDPSGFYVAAFPGNQDFVRFEKGRPATVIGGGKTTYGAFTAGLNIKPPLECKFLQGVMIRPELRIDGSLNDTKPFDSGKSGLQFTPAVDVIVSF